MDTFQLYREKAHKLLNSSFAARMRQPNGIEVRWDESGLDVEHKGPEQESIDAFLLTFRFFIQGNESIAFKNMEESLQKDDVGKCFLADFKEVRVALNEYLDSDTMFNIGKPVRRISNRQLMETFIYGDLGHTNYEAKRENFLYWRSKPLMIELMKNEFRNIISKVLIAVKETDSICKEIIQEKQKLREQGISRHG